MGKAASIGQGKAFKNGWIKKNGSNLVRAKESIEDQTKNDLEEIKKTTTHSNTKTLNDLKKRKLVEKQYVDQPSFSLFVR